MREALEFFQPQGGFPNRHFVDSELREKVISWAHDSVVSCHPRGQKTIFQVSEHFWWPSMGEMLQTTLLPALYAPNSGLQALLLLDCYICCLYFIAPGWTYRWTCWIVGNTTALTLADRVLKMSRFIPSPNLHYIKETVEALLTYLWFSQKCFPTGVLSFQHSFGGNFGERILGATVSSSGYHPHSIGQS